MNPDTGTVKLGELADSGSPEYDYGTRTSDFITGHFRAFTVASDHSNWNLVIDECCHLINVIQNVLWHCEVHP